MSGGKSGSTGRIGEEGIEPGKVPSEFSEVMEKARSGEEVVEEGALGRLLASLAGSARWQ